MNKFALLSTLTILSACNAMPKTDAPDYWQRVSASEAAHIRGASAQSILNRDIAHCMTELKELVRLGEIKIPQPEPTHPLMPAAQKDTNLLDNHAAADNFQSCMENNGWERTITLNKATLERASHSYYSNHVKYREKYLGKEAMGLEAGYDDNDFGDLNE
ncbi:MAG: hypothetical protein ACRBCT_01490 [Alphaproteobacteria bacterium]